MKPAWSGVEASSNLCIDSRQRHVVLDHNRHRHWDPSLVKNALRVQPLQNPIRKGHVYHQFVQGAVFHITMTRNKIIICKAQDRQLSLTSLFPLSVELEAILIKFPCLTQTPMVPDVLFTKNIKKPLQGSQNWSHFRREAQFPRSPVSLLPWFETLDSLEADCCVIPKHGWLQDPTNSKA